MTRRQRRALTFAVFPPFAGLMSASIAAVVGNPPAILFVIGFLAGLAVVALRSVTMRGGA